MIPMMLGVTQTENCGQHSMVEKSMAPKEISPATIHFFLFKTAGAPKSLELSYKVLIPYRIQNVEET